MDTRMERMRPIHTDKTEKIRENPLNPCHPRTNLMDTRIKRMTPIHTDKTEKIRENPLHPCHPRTNLMDTRIKRMRRIATGFLEFTDAASGVNGPDHKGIL